ncbi:MAG TPA: UDP-3-O-acyl-N-acetylglucosamine deacetylase [Isosphaeraceae bacterium]|nr:UDP-3-O-acyl-N-acetylglucosamine deacetylase [Isosphaeraceae bacterium]
MLTAKRLERTIAREARVQGIGFLTGADVTLSFKPAPAGSGVVFVRADLPSRPAIPAHVRHVVDRQRRTAIERGGDSVEMIEHVMAALAGLRIDNCAVELDASETPGCDGSSRAFVEALCQAGVVEQSRKREVLSIDRPITVRDGASTLTAFPGAGDDLVLTYNLDYPPETPIGRQCLFLELSPETFQRELAPSRTFLLESEARAMQQAGLGRRLSPADLLIFGQEGPIGNHLRFPDECVRHKILDMVGDLALLGRDLAGHVVAHRSGHMLNAELVRGLLQSAEQSGAIHHVAASEPVLDIRAIMKILPHRYPFLLVDRVLELDSYRRVRAIKNVTINEQFFHGHWPSRPIMPGVLIVEALAQAAGILIAQKVNPETHFALIVSIDSVKIRRPVVPGDQLELEVEGLRIKKTTADMQGVAKVAGQVVAEAKMRFVLIENKQQAA